MARNYTTKRSRKPCADPVVTEIVRNGVIAVTEEMKTNLMRTAYNIIIYEALDFTTGLFTVAGETVSIGIGLPMFIRGMAETVKAKIRHFGRENMRPGDIYVTNDSYLTGSHLNHVTLTLPIFYKKALVGFSCCMAHWLDIGGTLGGITTDIFSEGLQIPILKLHDRGEPNETLIDLIRQNMRLPSRAMGDLRAQIIAVKTGERRFLELVERYGRDAVLRSIDAIMNHSEALARARTCSIPDGVYEAESFMDDDGIEIGKTVPIRVRVVVKGEEMTVDLTGVSRQVRGSFNSGITTGYACSQVAYKCLTSPTDYPINDGSFRSLKVIVPPGRVVSAVRPAPMRWWMTYPMTIVDTVFKALAPVIPERAIAGHHADLVIAQTHGNNTKTSEFFLANFGPLGGGWGAKRSEDGVSGTVCINDGDTHNSPSEQSEVKFPLVVERYALIADSGGAGHYRGGLGLERVVRARVPMTFNSHVERAHCRPWGLEGGGEATGNEVAIRVGGEWKTDFPNAKVLVAHLQAGDAFRMRSGGGGGYGLPMERPIADVEADARQGYISLAAARNSYGVVLDPKTFAADLEATERLRASMREAGVASKTRRNVTARANAR
ncbi:MAG: hydantoinase B/oxoprolinase family protein [Xanthobacteraceae bacterium]